MPGLWKRQQEKRSETLYTSNINPAFTLKVRYGILYFILVRILLKKIDIANYIKKCYYFIS